MNEAWSGRWRRPILAVAVVVGLVGLVLASMGGYRLYRRLTGPPPVPRQVDVGLIAGWMTVPYVGRNFHIPADDLFTALGIPPEGNGRRSLNGLADQTWRDPQEVITIVRQTVTVFQTAHPPPSKPEPKSGDPTPPSKPVPPLEPTPRGGF